MIFQYLPEKLVPLASVQLFKKARRMQRCIRVLLGSVVLVLSLGLGLAFIGNKPVSPTEAVWNSSEASAASFAAGTVPAPQLTRECQFRPGVLGLGARVRIFWRLPPGYTLDDVEVHASTSGLGSVLAPLTGFSVEGNTEGSPSQYQTDVPTNLLGGLLGLGSELEIAILVKDGNWTSETASIASNAGLIAGIGGNCRNLT